MDTWIKSSIVDKSVELFLHCQPGAKKTEVQGIHGDRLKIRLAAPPVEGKANEALITWLSKTLSIPKNQVDLLSGDTGRQKRIQVIGVTVDEVKQAFEIS